MKGKRMNTSVSSSLGMKMNTGMLFYSVRELCSSIANVFINICFKRKSDNLNYILVLLFFPVIKVQCKIKN